MAKLNYTIVCDDVRSEQGRKHSLMGIYTTEILVPNFPFVFSRLAFFQNWLDVKDGQRFKISVRGEGFKGITVEGLVERGDILSPKGKPFAANLVLNFNAIRVPKPGRLIFETTILEDQSTHTYEINVALANTEQLR